MVMAQVVPEVWTAEMAQRLLPDDGNRYEVIDGVLHVTPPPGVPHQSVLRALFGEILLYLRTYGLDRTMFSSPADISWDAHTLVQPDLFVVPPGRTPRVWSDVKHSVLAIEIISPTSRRRDLVTKRELYLQHDVEEYWVVDIQTRAIHVFRPDSREATVVTKTLSWKPSLAPPDTPALSLDIAALFGDLVDEESD